MKKTAVVYQSKYGATGQYAQWLAKELACDLFEKKQIKPGELAAYNTIVYGAGVYAGQVGGIGFLAKNADLLKGKNLIVFACGLTDPADETATAPVAEGVLKALTPALPAKVFHLRGSINYQTLGRLHKTLIGIMCRSLQKKPSDGLTTAEKSLLSAYTGPVDLVSEAQLLPMVDYIRSL